MESLGVGERGEREGMNESIHCTSILDGPSRACNKDRTGRSVHVESHVPSITAQRELLAEFDLNCSDHGNKKSPSPSSSPSRGVLSSLLFHFSYQDVNTLISA